jgi:hypothetical protein
MIRRFFSNVGSLGPLVSVKTPAAPCPPLPTSNPGSVEAFYSLQTPITKLPIPNSLQSFFDTIGQPSLLSRKPLGALFEWLRRYNEVPDGPALSLYLSTIYYYLY